MSITARVPPSDLSPRMCTGCDGTTGAPLATVVSVGMTGRSATVLHLCAECASDLANAVGFMSVLYVVRLGGPRKRKAKR